MKTPKAAFGGFWNYRIVRRVFKDEVRYAIHEAHYDDTERKKRNPRPHSISLEPTSFVSDTPHGFSWHLLALKRAMKKKVLSFEEFDKTPQTGDANATPTHDGR